jgi:hypothetical protein
MLTNLPVSGPAFRQGFLREMSRAPTTIEELRQLQFRKFEGAKVTTKQTEKQRAQGEPAASTAPTGCTITGIL